MLFGVRQLPLYGAFIFRVWQRDASLTMEMHLQGLPELCPGGLVPDEAGMAVVTPHIVPEGCPVPVQAPCRETRCIAGRQEETKALLSMLGRTLLTARGR